MKASEGHTEARSDSQHPFASPMRPLSPLKLSRAQFEKPWSILPPFLIHKQETPHQGASHRGRRTFPLPSQHVASTPGCLSVLF